MRDEKISGATAHKRATRDPTTTERAGRGGAGGAPAALTSVFTRISVAFSLASWRINLHICEICLSACALMVRKAKDGVGRGDLDLRESSFRQVKKRERNPLRVAVYKSTVNTQGEL